MKYVLKFLLFIYVCLLTYGANAQGHNPPQKIPAWYEFTAVTHDSANNLPKVQTPVFYRVKGSVYWDTVNNQLVAYDGTNFRCITCKINGISDSLGYAKLGGTIDRYTVLDDSTAKKVVLFKGTQAPDAVFNLGPFARWVFGEDTIAKTSKNTNYVNDSHSNLNSPLMVLRNCPLSDGFNQVPFLYMSSSDANDINGFYFQNFTSSQNQYEPVMYTIANKDSSSQQHGMTFRSYMKHGNPSAPSFAISTAWTFQMSNTDSFSIANKTGNKVNNVNIFAFETGTQHPLVLDRFFHMRLGDIGTTADITANAQYEIVSDTATRRLLQSGTTGINAFEAPIQVGGTFPHTPTASAKLEIISTTQGVLMPRMTTTQKLAISSPAEGLQVYDLTLHQMSYYNGSTWINF